MSTLGRPDANRPMGRLISGETSAGKPAGPGTCVLLTAFGGFPGAAYNPTQAIAARLSGARRVALQLANIDLVTAILPVEYSTVENRITMLLARYKPDCVLHLGLAANRRKISIETRARNRLNIIHPDAAGRLGESLYCARTAPFMRRASYRAPQICSALAGTQVRVALSIDAGDYLCNQALFATLGQFCGPAGFIHVPRPRKSTRPIRISRSQRMSIRDITRAIEAAIRDMAQQFRQQKWRQHMQAAHE